MRYGLVILRHLLMVTWVIAAAVCLYLALVPPAPLWLRPILAFMAMATAYRATKEYFGEPFSSLT